MNGPAKQTRTRSPATPLRSATPGGIGACRCSRWTRIALCLTGVFVLAACSSASVTHLTEAANYPACIRPSPERNLAVGVAFSGGGSRAAMFGAAGLEALGRLPAPQGGSVLEQVEYLSSVSGGTMSAAYYALHKPPRGTPVLAPDGTMSETYRNFFADFRTKLNQDFQSAVIRRQLGAFRFILNSALAARSLEEILDERLLGPATFADLGERESRGDSPWLMVNATLYNNGRRLQFSTLPPDASQYDFFEDLDRSLTSRGATRKYPEVAIQHWAELLPITPLDINMDPCPVPVAFAAAASASFPPLVGPITFTVGDDIDYWHAGDGGLYENLGLESLMFMFLKKLQDQQAHRALILSFDSAYPFSVGTRLLARRAEPWTFFSYDFSRIPAIMEERATSYWSLFYRSLQAEGVFPDDQVLHIVFLNHAQAEWADDLSDLPQACRGLDPPLTTPEMVRERVAEIPTALAIDSECDRQLIATAAAKVVEQHRDEIEQFLAAPDPPLRQDGAARPAAIVRPGPRADRPKTTAR